MPTYTYYCFNCDEQFEVFCHFSEYKETCECPVCKKNKDVNRLYCADAQTQFVSVKKSDNELKTLGDLALRNSERMSDDEKDHLFRKHNDYRLNESTKELPTGMTRVKPKEKIKWPGSQKSKRRTPKQKKKK
jgi:putative FmdB family regulatory protein